MKYFGKLSAEMPTEEDGTFFFFFLVSQAIDHKRSVM